MSQKQFKNETKKQKSTFLGMLMSTLGASLLGDMLTGNVTVRTGYGANGKGILRAAMVLRWIFNVP